MLIKAKERQTSLANKKRKDFKFQVGDKVRLSTQDFNFAGNLSRKLLPKFTREFTIIKEISPVAYKLDLPSTWKIHPVFHISKLKPYRNPNDVFPQRQTAPTSPLQIEGHEEFEVDKILRHRTSSRGRQFLIRWLGYGPEDDSWVSERDIHAPLKLRQYWRLQRN
jgi:Chromo (CHRromatin Organisation MOdifier) domain